MLAGPKVLLDDIYMHGREEGHQHPISSEQIEWVSGFLEMQGLVAEREIRFNSWDPKSDSPTSLLSLVSHLMLGAFAYHNKLTQLTHYSRQKIDNTMLWL